MEREFPTETGMVSSKEAELFSADLIALNQIVSAIAVTLTRIDPSVRKILMDELQARLDTLEELTTGATASDEAHQARLQLSLLMDAL